MSVHALAETIETPDGSIALRRVDGPEALELFLQFEANGRGQKPDAATDRIGPLAESAYRALSYTLEQEGCDLASVVRETVFVEHVASDLEAIRAARRRVLADRAGAAYSPATTEIEQPPLFGTSPSARAASLTVSLHALRSKRDALRVESVSGLGISGCDGCAPSHGVRVHVGDQSQLLAGGLVGEGATFYDEALAMFAAAEDLLREAGMAFGDVVRTWIHLRDIERDYAELNRARRMFFEARGIDPVPASTGIGGGPAQAGHDVCLAFEAIRSDRPIERKVMTTPTLNEAPSYGADFVRGMRVVEANKVTLHVSGTASIDEAGQTAHPGDFEAQADRMLLNIATLLEGQGASFADIVSAVTYVKRPADAARLREKFYAAGFEGFPNALVHAQVCRPELLCESEVLAVLERSDSRSATDV